MLARPLLLVLFGFVFIPDATEAAPLEVVARVYNTARVSAERIDAAVLVATRALVGSGIEVSWRDCERPDVCSRVPADRELVIRLVRSSLTTGRTAGLVLGEASIDTAAGAGVLATVYVDRVTLMADISETDAASLLGRAIAHELGHLLLATNAHSASGLMRAQWTQADLRRNEITDWVLTRKDAEAIHRRLR
jgi:hypothetical protein